MSSYIGDQAKTYADQAAGREGDKLTDAVGEGLAAVAYALVDVAEALRELAEAQQS